jgi:hypothetical protein
MKKQVLFLIALSISILVYSQSIGDQFIDNFITYEITSLSPNNVETVDYDTNGGTVVTVPDTVTYNTIVFDVTSVGSACFFDKQLTSITIGNNIISCGQSAFRQNQLVNVVIPDNVLNIGNYSFLNNQLTNIDFGSGLTSIPEQSFQNNQFTSLNIPDNITAIGWRAFESNNQLTCITVEATVPPTIITGTGDSFNTRSNIDLTIPTGTANDYAAATWTGFNSVAEGITGNFTVNHITYAITSSTNNTVKTTDYNTTGGTVVNIPATVTRGCETYTVTEIGNYAFASNNINDPNNLTSVTLPNTITYIGVGAFSINNITTLTIPDSVINIDDGAFANSQNLTNLVLGNNLTTIGDFSFRFCPLNDITIPESVTNIGVVAFGGFGGTDAITNIYCQGMVPPTISTSSAPNSDTFNQARSTIHLHIPAGTMGAYVTDPGALWTGFNPVTEDALSIDEFDLAGTVKVVTATDALKIISNQSLQLQDYTMYSISGIEIVRGTESTISTSSFASGIYILKLNFDRGTVVRKIIIN